MPELPEVETVAAGLRRLFSDHCIERVVCRSPRLRYPLDEKQLNLVSRNSKICRIKRRGKYLIWELESRHAIIAHLGMSGAFRYVKRKARAVKHEHVRFLLTNGFDIRYLDPRRFGAMIAVVDGNWQQHRLIAKLGPEPLENPDPRKMHQKACKRSITVKEFIMDQKVIVGVGNIYANEALFAAGIHPQTPAYHVSLAKFKSLLLAIQKILAAAIDAGGTTLSDEQFTDPRGNYGQFQLSLNVYGREQQPCVNCKKLVQCEIIGSRSSFFCSYCQRLTKKN